MKLCRSSKRNLERIIVWPDRVVDFLDVCLKSTYYSEKLPPWPPCFLQWALTCFFFCFFLFFIWTVSLVSTLQPRLWKRMTHVASLRKVILLGSYIHTSNNTFHVESLPFLDTGQQGRRMGKSTLLYTDSNWLHFGAHHSTHAKVRSLHYRARCIAQKGENHREKNKIFMGNGYSTVHLLYAAGVSKDFYIIASPNPPSGHSLWRSKQALSTSYCAFAQRRRDYTSTRNTSKGA